MININTSFRATTYKPPGAKNAVPPVSPTLESNPYSGDERRRHLKDDWLQPPGSQSDKSAKQAPLLTTTALTSLAPKIVSDVPLVIYDIKGAKHHIQVDEAHDLDQRL